MKSPPKNFDTRQIIGFVQILSEKGVKGRAWSKFDSNFTHWMAASVCMQITVSICAC